MKLTTSFTEKKDPIHEDHPRNLDFATKTIDLFYLNRYDYWFYLKLVLGSTAHHSDKDIIFFVVPALRTAIPISMRQRFKEFRIDLISAFRTYKEIILDAIDNKKLQPYDENKNYAQNIKLQTSR